MWLTSSHGGGIGAPRRSRAGDERAVDPGSRVANGGPLVQGDRHEAKVQCLDLSLASAAEDDRRCTGPKRRDVKAKRVRIVAVRVEAKAPAYGWNRSLPADHEMVVADDDLSPRPQHHPRLGIGEDAGTERVPAAELTPDLRMLWDVGAHRILRQAEETARERVCDRHPGRREDRTSRVFAKARTPIPASGVSTMLCGAGPDSVVTDGHLSVRLIPKNARPMPVKRGSGW